MRYSDRSAIKNIQAIAKYVFDGIGDRSAIKNIQAIAKVVFDGIGDRR
jgi:hypothetical protein